MEIKIGSLQAEIIYKALYYTARAEKLDIPDQLTKIYEVAAENNPNETYVTDVLGIMEMLTPVLEKEYSYILNENEEE